MTPRPVKIGFISCTIWELLNVFKELIVSICLLTFLKKIFYNFWLISSLFAKSKGHIDPIKLRWAQKSDCLISLKSLEGFLVYNQWSWIFLRLYLLLNSTGWRQNSLVLLPFSFHYRKCKLILETHTNLIICPF